jgi:RNA polymerase sigma-70 factor (ECF subfamily)
MSLSDKHTIKEIHIDKLTDIKQLFDYYYRPLVLYAEEYLKDREAAEDVV